MDSEPLKNETEREKKREDPKKCDDGRVHGFLETPPDARNRSVSIDELVCTCFPIIRPVMSKSDCANAKILCK